MINIKRVVVKQTFLFSAGVLLGLIFLLVIPYYIFNQKYKDKVYPGVYVNNDNLSGKTKDEVQNLFKEKNLPFKEVNITLFYKDKVATLPGEVLNIRLDSDLSTDQAFSVGRTRNLASDFLFKIQSLLNSAFDKNKNAIVVLSPVITYNSDPIDETLSYLKENIDVKPIDPLFSIDKNNNKVTAFKLGADGMEMNLDEAKQKLESEIKSLGYGEGFKKEISFELPVYVISPNVKETEADNLGISSLLGTGYSYFQGSIPGRIHNLTLASSILHGQLIPPGGTFSFNKAVGDISAATGYQSAYIIKNGRTILGDGGGVCQVSTTLFRAAMDAGLPIVERAAHSYRVHYYEEGNFPPGIDATVFDPSPDLKIKNDTKGYILIQTESDPKNYKLTFRLYGTSDGRKGEISNEKLWSQTPPPEPLYQDDPTLPVGTVKQVDWAAWGAKASFDYTVTRNGEVIYKKTFKSNFQPWQAVYLRGTKQ